MTCSGPRIVVCLDSLGKEMKPYKGKIKIDNPQRSMIVWEICLSELKSIRKVGHSIFIHATSCGLNFNWPLMRCVYAHGH